MKQIKSSEFKAKCLALLDRVADTGEPLEITKRGKPVARVVPVNGSKHEYPQMALKGKFKIVGDIMSPVLPPLDEWDCWKK